MQNWRNGNSSKIDKQSLNVAEGKLRPNGMRNDLTMKKAVREFDWMFMKTR